jgi:hypothetical protein
MRAVVTEQESSESARQTERWVFGGSRADNGKRYHCWVDAHGTTRLYKATGRFVVGSIYETTVQRHDNPATAGRVTLYGTPRYTGDRADKDLHGTLAAQHRAAEVALDLAARERADKRADPLEHAIARLCELAAKVPASQRTGFAVYVATRLTRAWR